MNPLPPRFLNQQERRAELCRLLATGLVRLRMRQSTELFGGAGESSLHFAPDRSGHAIPPQRRDA
jgi:hypothetical protein